MQELRAKGGAFSRLVEEHGTTLTVLEAEANADTTVTPDSASANATIANDKPQVSSPQTLIQDEDRDVGMVPWNTYTSFFATAGSVWWFPVLFLAAALAQAVQVARCFWLLDLVRMVCSQLTQSDLFGILVVLPIPHVDRQRVHRSLRVTRSIGRSSHQPGNFHFHGRWSTRWETIICRRFETGRLFSCGVL